SAPFRFNRNGALDAAIAASEKRSALEVILLAEVVADLDQHRDAFGIARFGNRRVIGHGAKFPAVAVAQHRDDDAVGTIGVNLQFGPRHRDQFSFGLGWLGHRHASPDRLSTGRLPLWRASVEGRRMDAPTRRARGRLFQALKRLTGPVSRANIFTGVDTTRCLHPIPGYGERIEPRSQAFLCPSERVSNASA